MLLLLRIPEPEYRMSRLYVEVTSADSAGGIIQHLFSTQVSHLRVIVVNLQDVKNRLKTFGKSSSHLITKMVIFCLDSIQKVFVEPNFRPSKF